jgi:limonene-1,2-epoxide hydrolase
MDMNMSLTNSPSVETYKAYAEALNALDIYRTRTYLHDDVTYQGPVGETRGADAYLQKVSAVGLRQEVRKIFVDGDDVCVLADLSIAKVPGVRLFGCGWFQVKEGKIVSIRTIFDPRPLAQAKAGALLIASGTAFRDSKR